MNYIKNEGGDIKVMTEKGEEKWIPETIVNDPFVMKLQNLTVVPAPMFLPPIDEDLKETVNSKPEATEPEAEFKNLSEEEFSPETIEDKPAKGKSKK